MKRIGRAATVAVLLLASGPGAQAQLIDTRLIGSGFAAPLFATAPSAGGPLYVVEKGGAIQALSGGMRSSFLSIPVASSGEQGLLGLAFDPGYANPGSLGYRRYFVNYIDSSTRDSVIASYLASTDGLSTLAASRQEVMRWDQPDGLSNHKAGWIGFKPGDANHLYINTGDGGSGNDPLNSGQRLDTVLGKILRIDVNRDDFASTGIQYGIPADNPFVASSGARGEIFAYGLRNPWRASFDRQTGNLWLADVGQGAREEVNFIDAASRGGQNFGWRVREGETATPGVGGPLQPGMVDPVLTYGRTAGASITGGYVVRDANSWLNGRYVFGDFVSGRIWAMAGDGSAQSFASAIELTDQINAGAGGALTNIASFGEGANGELYIVDFTGKVVQLTAAIPEPGTWLMMGLGLLALAGAARRRAVAGQARPLPGC